METVNKKPEMQQMLCKLIEIGDVIPASEKQKNPTVFSYTVGKKDILLFCNAKGDLFYSKTGRPFVPTK